MRKIGTHMLFLFPSDPLLWLSALAANDKALYLKVWRGSDALGPHERGTHRWS